MAVEALVPNDPRVEHKFSTIGDLTYHYMLAKPKVTPVATVVLCHGWPDLGMGWRYQVPHLLSLKLQVIVPDMLGYGRTSAPESHEAYAAKKMAGHIAALIKEVTDEPIILGGHDWGAWFVWRFILYHPELVRGVFAFCVPYPPPLPVKITLQKLVKVEPTLRYQLQIASGATENMVQKSPERLRGLFNALFGGTTPEGEPGFSTDDGLIEDRLERLRPTPLMGPEMLDFYVQEYLRNGLHGPCNWYRTRETNSVDEIAFAQAHPHYKIEQPAMLVMTDNDVALPLKMAEGQEKHFAGDFKLEVIPNASHWILVRKAKESNQLIEAFVARVLGGGLKASL